MLDKILLVKGQNYSERIITKFNEYSNYKRNEFYEYEANFNYNDGITTSINCNLDYTNISKYNYVVVESRYANETLTRWFILSYNKLSGNMYTLTLRRDLIADYSEELLKAETYVEKGIINEFCNPLIYNRENFESNKIKVCEKILKQNLTGGDFLEAPCLYLYLKDIKDNNEKGELFNSKIIRNAEIDIKELPEDFTTYRSTEIQYFTMPEFRLYFNFDNESYVIKISNDFKTKTISKVEFNDAYIKIKTGNNFKNIDEVFEFLKGKLYYDNLEKFVGISTKQFKTKETVRLIDYFDENELNKLFEMNEKYFNVNNKDVVGYFEINVFSKNRDTINKMDTDENILFDNSKIKDFDTLTENIFDLTNITTNYSLRRYAYVTRYKTYYNTYLKEDAYKAEAIVPLSKKIKDYYILGFIYETSEYYTKRDLLQMMSELVKNLGNELVLDLQILPYNFKASDIDVGYYYGITFSNNQIFVPSLNYSTYKMQKYICSLNLETNTNILDFKTENQTSFARITSPNFNGSFEIDLTKFKNEKEYIGDVMVDFYVDIELKPFQPYIHVNPAFKGLMGSDFNDPNGLILNGDFSLTQTSSEWANYQTINKNYQTMFNREIQNLNTNRNLEIYTSALSKSVGSVLGGAIAGATAGGPVGAIGGALFGGVSSTVGLLKNEILYNEQLDYKHDMFNYNLENIKARPNNLTKVSSLNNNFKMYPIIEYYTCTDLEKEAFANKIKYNGMTVNVIGKIKDYMSEIEHNYIKGLLIRLDSNATLNANIFNELASELNKGFYANINFN